MTPSTLQAMRRLLFFSRPEAAALVAASDERPHGVSDRAWRQWEDGERNIPVDVADRIRQLAEWRTKTLAAREAQIRDFIAEAGTDGEIILIWYETLDDWATIPGNDPAIFWRPLQSVLADLCARFPEIICLRRFDPPKYAAWLGKRPDSESMRCRWAASTGA